MDKDSLMSIGVHCAVENCNKLGSYLDIIDFFFIFLSFFIFFFIYHFYELIFNVIFKLCLNYFFF